MIKLENALGGFLYPIYYFAFAPIYTAGAKNIFTYSDFMAVILFGMVGTTYSPTNVFCEWMFFYLPLLSLIPFFISIFGELGALANLISSSTTLLDTIYLSGMAFVFSFLATVYTAGPLIISASVFYPNTL